MHGYHAHMRVFLFLILLPLTTSCDSESRPPDQWRHSWASFADGSWVRIRTARTAPDGTATWDEKWVIDSRTDQVVTIRVVNLSDRSEDVRKMARRRFGEDFVQAGSEDLRIAGRDYACRKVGGREGNFWTLWLSPAFPRWPIREEEKDVDGRMITESRLLEPEETLKIGGREIVCAVFEKRVYKEGRKDQKWTTWLSQEVPGHLVRQDIEWLQEKAGSSELVVDFSVEK